MSSRRFSGPLALSLVLVAVAGLLLMESDTPGASGAVPSSATGGTLWVDNNCDGSLNAADVLPILSHLAQLPRIDPPCPSAGDAANVTEAGVEFEVIWGDADCDGDADFDDAFDVLLENFAALSPATCPAAGTELDIVFGVEPFEIPSWWRDFGDAPDGELTGYTSGSTTGDFPSSPGNNGPTHAAPFTVWLGEFVTLEGNPARPADDADDGLMAVDFPDCGDGSIAVIVNFETLTPSEREAPVYLNVLGDWNRDGRWEGGDSCAQEWAVQNMTLDLSESDPSSGEEVFIADVPTGSQAQEFWLRVTVSREQYDPSAGGALRGETEDYPVSGGQIFFNPPEDASFAEAEPQGLRDNVPPDFFCRSEVVPHGQALVTFFIEQTRASKVSGFSITNISGFEISQPTRANGTRAGGQVGANIQTQLKLVTLPAPDVRLQFQVITAIDTTEDEPHRMEGGFQIAIAIKGTGTDAKGPKPFDGTINCVFWADHTDGSIARPESEAGQLADGFVGGPGRTDARPGVNEITVIEITHGDKKKIKIDTNVPGKYDAATLTVFGPDGAQVTLNPVPTRAKDPPQAPGTGIRKITVATQGRAIEVQTIKDDPHRTERIFIRVAGKFADQTTFVDYYRIFISHGKDENDERLNSLLQQMAFVPDGHSQLGPEESFAVLYSTDNAQTLASRIPPDTGHGIDWPAAALCIAEPGTNFQAIMHGSTLFTVGYFGGGTDIFFLDSEAEPQGEASAPPGAPAQPQGNPLDFCTKDSRNITGGGPGNTRLWEQGAVCDGWIYTTDLLEFAAYRIDTMTGEMLPVPGGDAHRYMRCAKAANGMHLLTASTPMNNNEESHSQILSFLPCGGLCQQSATGFQEFIPAAEPGEHIQHAAISPDLSTVVYTKGSGTSSHIWAADFDETALTATNHRQLTTEGGNTSPAWSPDSQEIAFLSSRDGFNEIYVMKADGSDERNVSQTPGVSEFTPSWQLP